MNQLAKRNQQYYNPEPIVYHAEIDTIEALTDTLQELRNQPAISGSKAIGYALNAQLKIINSVNSATLVDSSFDLIFAEFKKAVSIAAKGEERALIREKVHIYMNSYIFFLDAKLKHSFKRDDEDTDELMEQAAHAIVENSADVMMLAGGAGIGKVAVPKIAGAILQKSKQKPGLIKKLVRWINKEKRQKQETANFHRTLDFLFKKLDKHKKIIGQSDITAGLVSRWTPEVHKFRTESTEIGIAGIVAGFSLTGGLGYLYLAFVKMQSFADLLQLESAAKMKYIVGFVLISFLLSYISSKIINSLVVKNQLRKLEKFFTESDYLLDEK